MDESPAILNDMICSQCGHRLISAEQGLEVECDHYLCAQCYRLLLVPGHKAGQMENLD